MLWPVSAVRLAGLVMQRWLIYTLLPGSEETFFVWGIYRKLVARLFCFGVLGF